MATIMKELSIEEKAYKAYTELINRLEDVKNAIKKRNYGIAMDILYKPYPEFQITTSTELKESEDERIRKKLIDYFKGFLDGYEDTYKVGGGVTWEGLDVKNVLAWLEKKGESSVCKIKIGETYKCIASPRYTCFRRGDVYNVTDNFVAELINISSDCFVLLEKQDKQETLCDKCKKEQPSHSCQDITALGRCALEMQSKQKLADEVEPFDKYKGLTDFERTLADICIGWIGEEYGWKQYIKDNADVLLKIAIKKFNSVQDAPFEQTTAWSEEDETGLGDALWAIQQARTIAKNENDMGNLWYAERWLKSLKDRVQPKQEWSEEDENILEEIKRCVGIQYPLGNTKIFKFLKSLKNRMQQQPQNTWKPSEEQIVALRWVLNNIPYCTHKEEISGLLEQLKKLKKL